MINRKVEKKHKKYNKVSKSFGSLPNHEEVWKRSLPNHEGFGNEFGNEFERLMKNILSKSILSLLLISFLVVPIVGLATSGATPPVPRVECPKLLTKALCEQTETPDIRCFWHRDAAGTTADPRCRHFLAPPPEVDFLAALAWIVNFVFFIFITVAVIFIIVAAFQFLTAAGDAEAIKKARTSILYAVIAIVVAVMAQGTVDFIRDRLVAAPPVPPPAPTTPPATLAPPVEPVEPVEPVV
ncbi:MAG: pilin [Candidatus Nealsonbacteria bacterium]|nr:pilin [Candidatus Nealsonbacteria bacterium]